MESILAIGVGLVLRIVVDIATDNDDRVGGASHLLSLIVVHPPDLFIRCPRRIVGGCGSQPLCTTNAPFL